MTEHIKGLNHFYNETTGETSVTWSYVDNPDLEHFVLEVWDDNKRKWIPYDNHMGIIKKAHPAEEAYKNPKLN